MARTGLIFAAALAVLCGGAAARAEDFQLDDVAIAAPLGAYRAKRIEVSGSPLTKDAAQKLLSAATPGAGEGKFAQLDAARIYMPELVSESKAGDYEQTAVYRDVSLVKVAKGVAETIDVAGMELTARRPGVTNRGRFGAIHGEGVDFPALLRIANAARTSADEPKKITTRKIAMANGEIEIEGGGKLTIGAVEGADFGGRPLAAPLASLAEAAPRPGGPEPSPTARRALAAMAADILTSLDVGALEMRDIAMVLPRPEEAAPESVRFKRIGLSKLTDGRIGGFTLEGVDAGRDDTKFQIERVDLAGLDVRAALAAAAAADPKPAAPRFDRLEIAGLAMNAPDGPISLGRAVVEAGDWLEVAPTRLSARLERAVVSLAGAGAARSVPLAALGYDKLDLSGALEAKYDAQKSELSLDRLEAEGAGMGAARVSLFLSRVPSSIFAGDLQSAQLALPAVSFWRADVGLTDRGLLQRYAAARAKDERKTEAQIRAEIATLGAGMTRALFAVQPNANPQVEALAGAVSAFAKGAPNLDVRAHAPDGLSVIDLSLAAQMGSLADRLKIEAKAH
ncbi:MAG TPA: hypothetical protein PKA55_14960 [Rhodoblastus sp.]|nr:hypothetical protein [Rhodoblastus sp.]